LDLTKSLGHARGVVATGGKVDCKDVLVEVLGIQVTAAEIVEEGAEISFKGGKLDARALHDPATMPGLGASSPPGEQGIWVIESKVESPAYSNLGHARGILVRKGKMKMEGAKISTFGNKVTAADALHPGAEMTLEGVTMKGVALVGLNLNLALFEAAKNAISEAGTSHLSE
jgi:hypothetical protein